MPANVQVGAILIEDWPLATQCLGLESEPYSGKWSLVNTRDSFALDREIHAAGWNFFFMATQVKAMFFGALRSGENPECSEADFRKGEAATLQRP
jgi:hypothetical protein